MKNQKGLTLIEILTSIVILSLIILVSANFFIQGAKFSKVSDEKYTDLQIARDVLSIYQAKAHSELEAEKSASPIDVDIIKELKISDEKEYYRAREAVVTIKENVDHIDSRVKNDILVIEVIVKSTTNGIENKTVLEGYSK